MSKKALDISGARVQMPMKTFLELNGVFDHDRSTRHLGLLSNYTKHKTTLQTKYRVNGKRFKENTEFRMQMATWRTWFIHNDGDSEQFMMIEDLYKKYG